MIGKHHIVVESPRLKYEFTIQRNLTIIQGDSATGKTTLVDLLRDYARNGNNGTIKLSSDKPCVVFEGNENNWREYLVLFQKSIIFIDEGYSFIRTKEFADQIRGTDNYYVLVTRDSLPCLPYSIHEVYGIRTSGRYHFPEQIYHEFYPIYENKNTGNQIDDTQNTVFIAEDSKAGFQFLERCCSGYKNCISAKGNSNVYSIMRKESKEKLLIVIADGAAFGAYIEKVMSDSVKEYHKDFLASFYTEGKNRDRILAVFPKEIRDEL